MPRHKYRSDTTRPVINLDSFAMFIVPTPEHRSVGPMLTAVFQFLLTERVEWKREPLDLSCSAWPLFCQHEGQKQSPRPRQRAGYSVIHLPISYTTPLMIQGSSQLPNISMRPGCPQGRQPRGYSRRISRLAEYGQAGYRGKGISTSCLNHPSASHNACKGINQSM